MAQSATLKAEARTKLGSRACRALRANGMIPANLQPADGKEHLDLAINEHEFLAARRNHVHLYDIEIGGQSESVVVRELEWDVFGDSIIHVEFKRVQRGVETETEVELAFVGMPKGVVNHTMQHISIFSLPSMIPDAIEVGPVPLGDLGEREPVPDPELHLGEARLGLGRQPEPLGQDLPRLPRALHRVVAVRRQPLDRDDRLSGRHCGNRQAACAHRTSVDVHRAGAAYTDAATVFAAGKPELLADHPEQRCRGVDIDRDRTAVDVELLHRSFSPFTARYAV